MPTLAKLVVTDLRNIIGTDIRPASGFNIFYGGNGSGKTSLLEAIFLLALGRSFRGHQQKPLIREGEKQATVFGETQDGLMLGIQRSLRGPQLIRIDGKKAESLAELTRCLPLLLINTDTFLVLEGAPRERRRFLDWGVFHVEHSFLACWRQARLALLNRNNLLKNDASKAELEPWTRALSKNAEMIDQFRAEHVELLRMEMKNKVQELLGTQFAEKFALEYIRGWDKDLYEQIQSDLPKDRKYGHTTSGPQKADLRFKVGAYNAAEVLSRGQLKLFVCALKIAQGKLLQKATQKSCIFLIDDLPAELDKSNITKVCRMFGELEGQVFLSCIDQQSLDKDIQNISLDQGQEYRLFHVKHGIIKAQFSGSV